MRVPNSGVKKDSRRGVFAGTERQLGVKSVGVGVSKNSKKLMRYWEEYIGGNLKSFSETVRKGQKHKDLWAGIVNVVQADLQRKREKESRSWGRFTN